MTLEEKYFSCNILLTDQNVLCGSLSFVRYWAMCVLYSSYKVVWRIPNLIVISIRNNAQNYCPKLILLQSVYSLE